MSSTKNSIPFIQTLHNDCSHKEDVHLLFCAHFTTFSHFRGIELRHFYVQNALRGPGLCNLYKSFYSCLFKRCIVIVHVLKIFPYILCTFHDFFSYF